MYAQMQKLDRPEHPLADADTHKQPVSYIRKAQVRDPRRRCGRVRCCYNQRKDLQGPGNQQKGLLHRPCEKQGFCLDVVAACLQSICTDVKQANTRATFCGEKMTVLPLWEQKEKRQILQGLRLTSFVIFQINWEKRILKSLNSMCTELNIPLARKVRRRPSLVSVESTAASECTQQRRSSLSVSFCGSLARPHMSVRMKSRERPTSTTECLVTGLFSARRSPFSC